MLKKIISLFIILLFCLSFASADAPAIQAKAAILINADSGQVLFAHNADEALPMASLTKIMTALLVLESGDVDATITTSTEFNNPGGTHIAIDHAETLTVKDLLYALLVESANDAAVALAEGQAGSVELFVEQMNARAAELGAKQTNFVNPHGLDDANHVASAADLAIIAARAVQNPLFREIVASKSHTIAPTNKKDEARNYLKNDNLFLYDDGATIDYNGEKMPIYDSRVDGVKSGYTEGARNCLVTSFSHNASRYVIVVLGAADKNVLYGDSKALMAHASEDFSAVRIVSEGEIITNIKVKNAEASGLNLIAAKTIERAVPKDEQSEINFEQTITLDEAERDSIIMGTKMGQASYTLNGEVVATVDLLAQVDVDERDLVGELTHALTTGPTVKSPLEVIALIVKIVLTLLIWRFVIKHIRRRRAKQIRDQKRAKILHKAAQPPNQTRAANRPKAAQRGKVVSIEERLKK